MLLAHGHEVTASAGASATLREIDRRLRVTHGDPRDAWSIERAVEKAAVLSWFDPRVVKTDAQENFRRDLTAAMTRRGVERLVNLLA
jgi:hypothetical protein